MDVYNTVQPEFYDLAWLKREYGAHLCFYGGISTQQFLLYASLQEVRQKTLEVLEIMSRGGGTFFPPPTPSPQTSRPATCAR